MTVSIQMTQVTLYLLVFVRLAACFMINPVFSRTQIPVMFRMGLVLILTFIVEPTVSAAGLESVNLVSLTALIIKEAMIGATLGYVMQLFIYMLAFAGDSIDTSMGLAMAKVMNPATNIQSGVAGSILTYMFILFLFASNTHLVMIRAFVYTFEVIPVGAFVSLTNICSFIITTFISVFNLALRIMIPFVACGLILEITLGILMKMIPQIHVFVINIQLKIILGIFLLLALSASVGDVMHNYIDQSMISLQEAIISFTVE